MEIVTEIKPRQRNTSLDKARFVAIIAVVMIHVSSKLVSGNECGSAEFFWANIFDSLSRIGVPLFVMTSGALLLDEDKPFSNKHLFSKRLPSILFLAITWSVIYAVGYEIAKPLLTGKSISIKGFVDAVISGHFHLWYLYMQVGLYLALPFLRKVVCNKNKNVVLMYLAVSLLAQFSIPVIKAISLHIDAASYLITFIQNFKMDFFNVYLAYFLAGWYIVHIGIPKKFKIAIYIAAVVSILSIMLYVNFTGNYKNGYSNDNLFLFVYAAGVFLALNNTKPGCGKIISTLSKYSFGIYAMHIVIIDAVRHFLPKTLFPPIYLLVLFAITLAFSLLATFTVSKLPLLKKLVRM